MSDKGALEIIHLFFASDEKLYDKRITNFFWQGGSRLQLLADGHTEFVDLTENDLVFITNGGCVENSSLSSQNPPASFHTEIKPSGG
ncbi:hypothetical protein GPL26_25445 [Enterocloster citroniae]|uniref:Uncharacterized protein n=1 Tax=Enterocloster citroniae TaxID=358743 RepID=A0AA41FK48_9FIRM|nr:hypothetical protein [Enterocloster citroniae]RGC04321.1 hypothetical protein DWZ14_29260 [Enterocloster citroniae]